MKAMKANLCAYSIGRKLGLSLAVHAALALLLVCGAVWALAEWQFERKHEDEWLTKAAVAQEILRAAGPRGEEFVLEKMQMYAQRRPGTYLSVQRADGSVLYRDPKASFDIEDDDVRSGSFEVANPAAPGGLYRATLWLDCSVDRRMLAALALGLTLLALGGGALVGGLAYWQVQRGLKPVHELAAQTRAIDARRLDQRLSLARPVAELQPALDQFNALMERLERAYVQLEAFNADVAHELRTPLAALIGHTELALSRERSASELRETLGGNLEELQRLSAMVNDMLFLASADRGASARRGAPVSLAALAREVVEFHEATLEDAALAVRIEGDATLAVDEPLVRRALSNLIGNATRYATSGTAITVQIAPERVATEAVADAAVRIDVANQGEGIVPAQLPRIFDRFFRADTARCCNPGEDASAVAEAHHGLGLAIVAAIARMHGGGPHASSAGGTTRVGFSLAAG
jgi:two-component system, OmpR family, heavy metal sensor histidine kinase CusS